VVNASGHIVGVLTFEALKDVLVNRDTWDWLLVADIMRPLVDMAYPEDKLDEVYERMTRLKIDQMPVVNAEAETPLGMLDVRSIRMKVNAELLNTDIESPLGSVA
jgi:CBS domain-containing protein